jgi:hypothetical protein
MKTPYGKECRYYYADYYRGRNTQECRLIQANPDSEAWKPALCQTCPVPDILFANACPNLALRARVGKSRFGLLQKVQVEAACHEYHVAVDRPKVGCGKCHLHTTSIRHSGDQTTGH